MESVNTHHKQSCVLYSDLSFVHEEAAAAWRAQRARPTRTLSPPPLSTEAVPCGNCHAVMWQLPRGGVAIANPKPFCRGYCQTKPLSWPGANIVALHTASHTAAAVSALWHARSATLWRTKPSARRPTTLYRRGAQGSKDSHRLTTCRPRPPPSEAARSRAAKTMMGSALMMGSESDDDGSGHLRFCSSKRLWSWANAPVGRVGASSALAERWSKPELSGPPLRSRT